jgi:hypothetical protein
MSTPSPDDVRPQEESAADLLPLSRGREMMSAKPIVAPRSGLGGEGFLPGENLPLDAFGRLRAALSSAVAGGESSGIGCHFWTRRTHGVPVEQLESLGLVTLIKTRIPVCEAHGCAIIATCSERITFAEGLPGRANRKFRLTVLGTQAAIESSILVEQIAEQPLARQILDLLAAHGASLGWLDLYWRLLEPEFADLEETGQRPTPPLSRSAVRFYLDLLVTAGLLAEDSIAGTVQRA